MTLSIIILDALSNQVIIKLHSLTYNQPRVLQKVFLTLANECKLFVPPNSITTKGHPLSLCAGC